MSLLALTLRHPWSFAVQRLGKDCENRTWQPPRNLIGQYIAIHGGAVPKGQAFTECANDARQIARDILTAEQRSDLQSRGLQMSSSWIVPGIVAVAKLERVVTASDSPWFFGPFGLVLADVTPLEHPIPHRGALGFWAVLPDAEALVRDAYARAHDGQVMP